MTEIIIGDKPYWNWKRSRLLEHIRELEARITELEAELAKQWVSVEERLPEGASVILLMYADRFMVCGGYSAKYGWYCDAEVDEGEMPTHWMPLPAPPTEAAGE